MPTEQKQYKNVKTGTMSDGTPIYASGVGTAPTTISSATLTPQVPITLPPPPNNADKYSGIMASGDAILASLGAMQQQQNSTTESQPNTDDLFNRMMASITPPPSSASAYDAAYAASPIAANQEQANKDAAAVQAEQDKYNVLNSQLQGLNYQYQTTIPNQTQQDATGRGITAAGLAPITAAAQRQKLLEIAPVQFQALVQQAAVANAQGKAALSQSILQQSQNHLDKIFALNQQDAMAQYEFRNKQIDAVYGYASEKEKARLEELKTKNQNDFTLKRDAINSANEYAKLATTNGQGDLAAKLLALDPTSKTYAQDVAKFAGQIKQDPLDVALKQAQIASANRANQPSDSAPTVKTINGVDMQWNGTTWEPIAAGAGNTATKNAADQLTFLRDTVASAKTLSKAAGPSGLSKKIGDYLVGDTKFRRLEALTNTLRTNVLTLMTDPGVKKYFGPQMSEADVRLMTSAGTTLNPENQSPTDMETELTRLDNLLVRMQTAVDNGNRVEQSGGKLQIAPNGDIVEIIDL